MKQLAQKFGAAKINVLEKMGKRDTTETEEMQNEARVCYSLITNTDRDLEN